MRLAPILISLILVAQLFVLLPTQSKDNIHKASQIEKGILSTVRLEKESVNSSVASNNLVRVSVQGEIEKTGWMDPYFDLAAHWAPVIVQYVESDGDYGYTQDYITNFDYDGDWVGNNNWENFDNYYNSLRAYVYYAVIESETHYFIFYSLFHPRDWSKMSDAGADEHENDMEALVLVVYKSGGPYGTLQVMMSRAHFGFNMYVADPAIGSGIDSVDGSIIFDTFDNWRPKIFVEAQGHGIYGSESEATNEYSYSSYVIYRFNGNLSEIPSGGGDSNVSYALIPIQKVLWPKALDPNYLVYAGGSIAMYDVAFTYQGYRYSLSFNLPKSFDGDSSKLLMGEDKANPPWGMHNSSWDDYGIHLGDWFFDPAVVVHTCFAYPSNYEFSFNYVYNPYITGQIPDETYPVLTVYSPEADVYYNTLSINISWYAHDDTSIRFVWVYLDGALVGTFGDGRNSILVSATDGEHNVTILAVDYWGNYREIIRTFIVDTTPPSMSVIAPRNDSLFGYSEIELSVNLSDNIELGRLIVYANDSVLFNGSLLGKALVWSRNYSFGDGDWQIKYVVLDKAGHEVTKIVYMSVDTTPPSIDVVEPYNGSLTGNVTIIVRWTAHDRSGIDYFTVYLDNNSIGDYPANVSVLEVNISSTGWHNITVVAYDVLGFANKDSTKIYVDHTDPSVVIYSPWNNDYVPAVFTVEWGGSDDYGVKYYEVYVNGSFYARTSGTNISVQLSETNRYRIDIVAYDYVGNTGRAYVIVMYDAEPPTVTFDEENYSVYLDSSVTITWSSQDNFEVDKREVSIDNGSYFQVREDSVSIIFQAGKHWIRVRVYDKAGNIGVALLIIYVDLASPDIQITWPYNNSYLSQSTITIEWLANDDTEIASQTIKISTRTYSIDPEAREFTVTLNDAWYTIELIVRDIANRTSIYKINIVIDTYRPDLTVGSPSNYSRFVDNVTVSWSSDDQNSGIREVDIYLNNSLVGSYGESGTIEISNLDPGAYIILARAVDKAGNKNEVRVVVYIAFLDIAYPKPLDNISSSEIHVDLEYLYVYSVELYVNGSLIGTGLDPENITITLDDGIWEITIIDSEISTLGGSVVFRIDTVAPIATLTCDNVTNRTDIVVSWNASDNGSGIMEVRLIVNDSVFDLGSEQGSLTLRLDEGIWNLTILVRDYANNTFALSKRVIVDLSEPEVFVSIENGTTFNTVYVNVSWYSWDKLSGVSTFALYVDGELVTNELEGNLSLMLEDGNHTITITVWDFAGNSMSRVIVFSVDAPAVIIVEGIINKSYYSNSTLTAIWSVFNGKANETHVFLNGSELNVDWNSSGGMIVLQNLSEGVYVLSLEVIDNDGITHNLNYIFVVDVTPPSITIVSPEDNYVTNSTQVVFEVVIRDNFGVGIAYVLYNGTNITITGDKVVLNLSEGLNKITFVAIDRAGNKVFVDRKVYVDTQAPIIELLNPDEDIVRLDINTTLNISWIVTDNYGLDRIEIYLNNTLYRVLPSNSTEISILVNGNTTIIIKAFDLAGNSNQVELRVVVQGKSAEQTSENQENPNRGALNRNSIIFIIILLILIIASSMTLLVKRKRKHAEEGTDKAVIEVDESEFEIQADFDKEDVEGFFL